jgi:LPS sulfotransferase NodH
MKAVIITSQRSGSNFLRHCLNSHPVITCEGELLIGGNIALPKIIEYRRTLAKIYRYVRSGAWNPVKILEEFYAREDSPVVSFKAMYNHLTSKAVRQFFRRHMDIRIIHLRRDNLLKQYVSKMLLGKKREQSWQPHSKKSLPIVSTHISPSSAVECMQRTAEQFQFFEDFFSSHKKIVLVYELMIEGSGLSDHAAAEVSRLLNVEYKTLSCDYVKVNPNDLRLIIDNYDEVAAAVRGTEFERFLE